MKINISEVCATLFNPCCPGLTKLRPTWGEGGEDLGIDGELGPQIHYKTFKSDLI